MKLTLEQAVTSYPLYKVKTLFVEYIQLGPPKVKLIGYNGSQIKNLSSIIVFLYHDNEKYKVLHEVADSSGHMVLGRVQTMRMKYVVFPQIQEPTVKAKPEKTIKAVQKEQMKAASEVVKPVIQQSTDSSITINGKAHKLPTTEGYILKEYA